MGKENKVYTIVPQQKVRNYTTCPLNPKALQPQNWSPKKSKKDTAPLR